MIIDYTEDTTGPVPTAYRNRGMDEFTAIVVHRSMIGYVWNTGDGWAAAYEDVTVASVEADRYTAIERLLESYEDQMRA